VLRGYRKLTLEPGHTARVRLPLNDRAFAYWDVNAEAWKVIPGCYGVAVGSSSRDLPSHGVIARGDSVCGPGAAH
jgi:beta-glucosidase